VLYVPKSYAGIRSLVAGLATARKVIVLGSGFTAVELAEQLATNAEHEVHLVYRAAHCLHRSFSTDYATRVDEALARTPLDLHPGCQVSAILERDGKAAGIRLDDGTELGADVVVTKTGVKVLELNARAGLKIQIANQVPLRTRLNKVMDLKVMSPEEGVEIARTLFSAKGMTTSLREENLGKPVIGIYEWVTIHADKPTHIKAKIDLSAEKNIIQTQFYDGSVLDMTLEGKRLKLPVEKGRVSDADMVLSGKYLKDFYVDPNKKFDQEFVQKTTGKLDEKVIQNIDQKISEIDEELKLLSYINPKNMQEQKDLFLSHQEFSPRFRYRECDLDLDAFRRELKKLPEVDHPLYPLFQEKIRHLEHKINLLDAVGESHFQEESEALFGGRVSDHIYRQAVEFVRDVGDSAAEDKSPILDFKKTKKVLEEFLATYKLNHWKIKVVEETVSDIQVTKTSVILLRKGSTFRENRLRALLVHEIGTHIFRFENGKQQPYLIFQRGTANYLQTEEGLAIWNQNNLGLALGQKYLQPAQLIIAIHMAEKMSFVDLFHYLKNTYHLENEIAWKLCVKVKRGFVDTNQPGAFTKDSVYFLGYRDILKFVKKGGDIRDLYVGKINIEDLPYMAHISGLVPPKFFLE